jgi:hypothetical protein
LERRRDERASPGRAGREEGRRRGVRRLQSAVAKLLALPRGGSELRRGEQEGRKVGAERWFEPRGLRRLRSAVAKPEEEEGFAEERRKRNKGFSS